MVTIYNKFVLRYIEWVRKVIYIFMKKIYSIHLEKMGDDFYFIQHLLMQMNENLSVGNLFLACVRSDKY